jgi:arginase family enzyme
VLSSVNIFDEDIGKQLDEMRPAAGFGMDALDPAVAPEVGVEARSGLN